jgi:predicted AlkP superfamily phosphohydrolase/phosphomutase
MIDSIRSKTDAILWLLDRDDWQLFLAGYYEIYRAGHNLWPIDGPFASEADPTALLEVYKALDTQLRRIVDRADDPNTTLILFALHGMAPNNAQNHLLRKIMTKLNARYLAEFRHIEPVRTSPNIIVLLRKIMPYNLQYGLAHLLGDRVQDWVVNRTLLGGLDWSRTPAFQVHSGGEGFIRLNIKGREAKGFFEAHSEKLRHYIAWLKDALLEIRVVETNEPLIKNIHQIEDLFDGPKSHFLPDLVLEWGPVLPAEQIGSDKIGTISERLTTGRGGNHTGETFVLITGAGAAAGNVRSMKDVTDIGSFVRSCLALNAGYSEKNALHPRIKTESESSIKLSA